MGNHDQLRIASRVGRSQAKVAALLLLTLRGTPTMYFGDETGMRDVPIPLDEIVDPQGLNMPELNISRDPSRTPMHWTDEVYAGFSKHKPWLRLPDNFKRNNVKIQKEDPYSMLTFYRKLLELRSQEPSLQVGDYIPVYSDKQIIAYIRQKEDISFLIILNFSHRTSYFKPKNINYKGQVIIST